MRYLHTNCLLISAAAG